ncbi:glycosyltransferase family 2 protein [Rhodanobacter sp. MP7CTX1]|jgi:putative glycosyltransferase|uniref:glycosyltransferase family 2 protein n=1 Tax=Rhodanobacter sp. MP7CTX1 TaxID=2723084 RepID=UPI00160E8441|nr:glycosyltransferase family 2 protein [Rhodanobacter sp. MP7CTX1]MBB6187474.1 putative glycosyltransferase [Rhodanobacter sp. MP7CTX1]
MLTTTSQKTPQSLTDGVPSLSVVTSVYRSERFLATFIDEMILAVDKSGISDYELIFVNDGSPDESLPLLMQARADNPRIKIVDLSRNFGHHKAMLAGLSHGKGDLTFIIDCDLEVRPGVLQRFLDTLRETHADVVYGVQAQRKGALVERAGGALFWRLFNMLSETQIPENVLSERLMKRRYVEALLSLGDRNVFLGGMMYWSGFRQVGTVVEKTQREGASTYSFRKRLSLLIEAVTSFSTVPLKLVLAIGLGFTLLATTAAIALLVRKLLYPATVLQGFTSLMLVMIGLAGLIITVLGVVGLYIARIYTQTQNRPLFIVRNFHD